MRDSTSRARAITAIVLAAGATSACTASEGILTIGLFGLGVIARMVWGATGSVRSEPRRKLWEADRLRDWDGQPWSATESTGGSNHGHHSQECADTSSSSDNGSGDCGDSGSGDSGGSDSDGGGCDSGGSDGGGGN